MSDRLMLISSDCHGGLKTTDYASYLEKEHHTALDEYLAEKSEISRILPANRPGMNDPVRGEFATQMETRLLTLEADGIVGEVIFPDGSAGNEIPFTALFGGRSNRHSELLGRAAMRAYNRWLGEHCDPDRQIGLAIVPLQDPEYASDQIRRIRGLGLRGIYPAYDGAASDTPPLYDARFDPLWAACVEDSLTVNFHFGSGLPTTVTDLGNVTLREEVYFWACRPLWNMILGGVLERFPELKVGFTELHSDWIPIRLAAMDARWEKGGLIRDSCPRRPSEYWHRQCFVGASSMSRYEATQRQEIGLELMMFGSDHSHSTSMWGCTRQYLQMTLGGAEVPEDQARSILGGNIARLYDLDVGKLGSIAERVGPRVDEILSKPTAETIGAIPSYLWPWLQADIERVPEPGVITAPSGR